MANINVRVTDEQKAELEAGAKRADLNLSDFARRRLLGEPDPAPKPKVEGETTDLAQVIVGKYGFGIEHARRLIAQGSVKIDGHGV